MEISNLSNFQFLFLNKKLLSLLMLIVLIFTKNMANAQELPTRDQIDDKYKWKLTDLYKSENEFENDFKKVVQMSEKFISHQGNITKSAKNLLIALDDFNNIWKNFSRLMIYANLLADTDASIGKNQILRDRTQKLASDIQAKTAFFSPELLTVDYSVIEKFIKAEKGLQIYDFYLQQIFRMKPHTLSTESEKVIAQMGPVLSLPNSVYSFLNDVELPLPTIKDSDGNPQKVSHGRYRSALYSKDRAYRERVYKGIYEGYDQLINSFAALYNGRVASRIAMANIRKFPSALDAALYENNIPVSVYNNLVETLQQNVKTLHRWGEIKRKALKLEKIRPYDTYVTLFEDAPKTYSYEEGVALVRESLKPLGEEYIRILDSSVNNGWIDVFETRNKRSGAYSNSSGCGVHPWILLNWGGTLDDVFVLTHEIGHNIHSFLSEQKQPFHYMDYSIFVAEVASTVNEALLLDYLVKQAKTKNEKRALIEKFLMNAQTTFFRQTRFAEFEKMIHERAEKGEYLSAEELSNLFAERYQYYWGSAMETNREEGLSWARVHHLTQYNFYVYQYSTGFAAAQALSEQIIKEGQPAIDRYLDFLSSGSSDTPINVLKKAGVDMSSPAPIIQTIQKMERYMDELEKLMQP